MFRLVAQTGVPHPPVSVLRRPAAWIYTVLILSGLVLALDPAIWLIETWLDPAYDSAGIIVAIVAVGLFAWSVTSRPNAGERSPRNRAALALLAVSAGVRLISQILAINTIGALCLVLDAFAIGLICRLDRRARAVSPAWLAAVFAFSLPLERILQRTIGYLLQELSAAGACGLLSMVYTDLVCNGVRLVVSGVDVLVDLPCSGARTLLLGLLGFAIAATVCRPRQLQAALGLVLTLTAAALANTLRISVVAVGIAEPERFGGISVMAQPWHDLIGLCALSLVCATIVVWARQVRQPVRPMCGEGAVPQDGAAHGVFRAGLSSARSRWISRLRLPMSLAMLFAATTIVVLPRNPVDVAAAAEPMELPLTIEGHQRRSGQLTRRERVFFAQYGGWAAKAEYGPHGLLLVRTTSPLRHLHAPEDCLRGQGFEVDYLGAVFRPIPTAIYRAVAPDGGRYRIDVSFVSDEGAITTNVATAVWHWLQGRASAWTAVQRISPEMLPPTRHARFTDGVLAALDLHEAFAFAQAEGARFR